MLGFSTSLIDLDNNLGPRLRRNCNDVCRVDDALCLVPNRLQQGILLRRREQVFLLERHDDRPTLCQQRTQRQQFRIGDIAVEHKNNQIGTACDFASQRLAILAARFIQPGRVDQENATGVDFIPVLHRRMPGLAMQGAYRECFFTNKRIQE